MSWFTWLSQKCVAGRFRVKQPNVARLESARHNPRLSSVLNQVKALHCHVMVVPDELLASVARLAAAGQRARGGRADGAR